jgi:hypothetical protein
MEVFIIIGSLGRGKRNCRNVPSRCLLVTRSAFVSIIPQYKCLLLAQPTFISNTHMYGRKSEPAKWECFISADRESSCVGRKLNRIEKIEIEYLTATLGRFSELLPAGNHQNNPTTPWQHRAQQSPSNLQNHQEESQISPARWQVSSSCPQHLCWRLLWPIVKTRPWDPSSFCWLILTDFLDVASTYFVLFERWKTSSHNLQLDPRLYEDTSGRDSRSCYLK